MIVCITDMISEGPILWLILPPERKKQVERHLEDWHKLTSARGISGSKQNQSLLKTKGKEVAQWGG